MGANRSERLVLGLNWAAAAMGLCAGILLVLLDQMAAADSVSFSAFAGLLCAFLLLDAATISVVTSHPHDQHRSMLVTLFLCVDIILGLLGAVFLILVTTNFAIAVGSCDEDCSDFQALGFVGVNLFWLAGLVNICGVIVLVVKHDDFRQPGRPLTPPSVRQMKKSELVVSILVWCAALLGLIALILFGFAQSEPRKTTNSDHDSIPELWIVLAAVQTGCLFVSAALAVVVTSHPHDKHRNLLTTLFAGCHALLVILTLILLVVLSGSVAAFPGDCSSGKHEEWCNRQSGLSQTGLVLFWLASVASLCGLAVLFWKHDDFRTATDASSQKKGGAAGDDSSESAASPWADVADNSDSAPDSSDSDSDSDSSDSSDSDSDADSPPPRSKKPAESNPHFADDKSADTTVESSSDSGLGSTSSTTESSSSDESTLSSSSGIGSSSSSSSSE
jgi:hypothetical protein